MVKHKKLKNTGILYETLLRKVMSEVESDKESVAYSILKTAFTKGTELRKEYDLYKRIFDFNFNNQQVVENSNDEFVDYVIEEYKKIDRTRLSEEKYKLVSKIKQHYGDANEFLSEKIDDYQTYASIYKMLESPDMKEKQQMGFAIVEKIQKSKLNEKSNKPKRKAGRSSIIKEHREMVADYNNKYATVLTESQMTIIEKYVASNRKFSTYFKQRLYPKVSAKLTECIAKTDNEVVRIKLTEATTLFRDLREKNKFNDEDVAALLLYQSLIEQYKKIR